MYIRKTHLSRRTMLKGAGAAIALPLLDAMVPAATALANTAAAPTPRMGFIFFPHGAVMDHWSPKTTGTDYEMSAILKPFEPLREHMTIVSGLRNKPAESSDPHGIIAGTWLSCVAPTDGTRGQADRGATVDQIAARHIGQATALPSLELSTEAPGTCSNERCGFSSTISFHNPQMPLPMENNPRKVFFKLFGQGDDAAEREAIVNESASILDSVTGEAASLRAELSPTDRRMVGDYLDSVREVERRVQKMKEQDFSGLDIPAAPVGVPGNFDAHLKLMMDLMALAWQGDLTRVSSFMMAREISMRAYTNLGISEAFHPLSHHGNNPDKLEKLVRIQNYHSKIAATFLQKLADMPDGDGSMLDHSIILFGANMSNSDKHNNDPLPNAVFGHAYGRIKGGQHLKYPQDTPQANLLLTLLQKADVPVESFGDATGTFSEI